MGTMGKKKTKKQSAKATLAEVTKEMAKPRVASSAKGVVRTWQLLISFPLLFARTALDPFHSLQPSVPIHFKVKDCGPRVALGEISYVPRVGMCMDIRLRMSSYCSLTPTHVEQAHPITWFTYDYNAGCKAVHQFYESVH